MPVDEEIRELDSPEQESQESTEDEFLEEMPGELCPVDVTDGRIDLDELNDEQKAALKELANQASQRDLTSYRLEVRDAWKQRYFDRGNQYLLPGKNGAWVLPKMVLMAGQSYDDNNQETNIYLPFRDTICAALTTGLPTVFFEAEDPSDPGDITAAEKSENTKKLLERANNMVEMASELVRYLCTDGKSVMYTHHVVDAQRFGWTKSDVDESLSVMPSDDLVVDGPGIREPRSQQVFEVGGSLEWKLPIQAKNIDECDYAQKSRELDISFARTKYAEFADKIEPSATPTAQSDYVRLARVSINMGMRPSNMTTDAQTYNCTEQLTWVRPSFYQQTHAKFSDEIKNWLLDTFPKGCMVAMVGNELVEAREESINDHLTLFHARPGDGNHRPSLMGPVVPIQEKLNDCMDLIHQSFMHLIPRIWVDPGIDLQGVEKVKREPSQYMKAPKSKEGKSIADNFYAEPQIQLAEGLLVYVEKLFGEFAQFLCGAFPALFGGDTKSNDTASGIQMQRDQALGRIGLTWRNIKAGYARAMRQAVIGVSRYQVGKFSGEIKNGQDKQMIVIDPEELKGNVRCFADSEESFPESWVIQRAIWNSLLTAAAKNPVIARIVTLPKNIMVMKDKIGTPELTIPEAQSEKKQLREIKILLETEPAPNPIFQAAQMQLEKLTQAGAPPEMVQLAQQKIQQANIPQFVSSVKVSPLDNDDFEAQAIQTFASDDEGIEAKADPTKQKGWMNLELHYQEHVAQGAQKKAAAAQNKPPSESINYKDLETPEAKMQMLKQAGIQIDEASLKLEMAKQEQADQQDREQKATALAAKNSGAPSGTASAATQS
jgi:hypothetical protein